MNRKEGLEFLRDKEYGKNPFPFGKGFSVPWQVMDEDIKIWEKVLLSMVISFNSNGKEFYMGNPALSEMFGLCYKSISTSIKRLHQLGYVKVYLKYVRYDNIPKGRSIVAAGKYAVDEEPDRQSEFTYVEQDFNTKKHDKGRGTEKG